ncbi:MAG: tail fiber protein [Pseudomonadota bacterium]
MRFRNLLVLPALLTALPSGPASAGTDLYYGEIMMTAGSFCPRYTMEADGRLLPIAQHQALFSLLGANFGGDGRTTFAIPDLRGRVPTGLGRRPGAAALVSMGTKGGAEQQTLKVQQMPAHTHAHDSGVNTVMRGSTANADTNKVENAVLASEKAPIYSKTGSIDKEFRKGSVESALRLEIKKTGGGAPFSVQQPYIGIRFCIATEGTYPPK